MRFQKFRHRFSDDFAPITRQLARVYHHRLHAHKFISFFPQKRLDRNHCRPLRPARKGAARLCPAPFPRGPYKMRFPNPNPPWKWRHPSFQAYAGRVFAPHCRAFPRHIKPGNLRGVPASFACRYHIRFEFGKNFCAIRFANWYNFLSAPARLHYPVGASCGTAAHDLTSPA